MSIDFKVSVKIPSKIESYYIQDDVTQQKFRDITSKSSFLDYSCQCIIAEFENLEDAEQAEADLLNFIQDLESHYELAIDEIDKAFNLIEDIISCHTANQIIHLLSNTITSEPFRKFMIVQATVNDKADEMNLN